MIYIFVLLASVSARAETLQSMPMLLSQPIEVRTKGFQQLGAKAYFAFLNKTAFDVHEPLPTRWRAITTMGRLDPLAFRPALDRALRSPEWFLRNAALIALLSDERARAVSWSLRLLTDPALVVRTQAVRNVMALQAREAEPVLWNLIFDPSNFKGHESLWIRAHMAEALAKFATPGRSKAFARLLRDEDSRLYKWAVDGLEASSGVRLSDPHEDVELRRQKWLARLGDSNSAI
jgi:hypothetical protein